MSIDNCSLRYHVANDKVSPSHENLRCLNATCRDHCNSVVSVVCSPSIKYYHRGGGYGYGGGGGWHGGRWNGRGGAALGLGLGLGLLGGALATAPYYPAPYYAAPGYGYAPAPIAPTIWYWCDPYQQYYPYVATCPAPWRQVVQ